MPSDDLLVNQMGFAAGNFWLPPTMRHEIGATSEQSKALLETTQHINEQLRLVRKLRHQRSAYLSLSEKAWIDNAIENTSAAVSHIADLAEPVPESGTAPRQRRLPGSLILHKLRYSIKDSPQTSAHLVRLSIATQSLNTAMSVLSASANRSSSARFTTVQSGMNAFDSSWNELSELIHRRRFNNSPSVSHEIQLAGVQRAHVRSGNIFQFEQQGSPDDKYSEGFAASYVKEPGSETYQTCAFRDEVEGGMSHFIHGHHLYQKDTDLASRTVDHHCVDYGLTLIIDTVGDWRQTTENALDSISALSGALTSGLMELSTAAACGRTQLQKMSHGETPRRKPVPGQASSKSGLLLPPKPTLEPSLRNSFDKETLSANSRQENSAIERLDKIQDVLKQPKVSVSTPSLCDVSPAFENSSLTTPSTTRSQPYRMSRGRELLERRAESFEDEADSVCLLPER